MSTPSDAPVGNEALGAPVAMGSALETCLAPAHWVRTGGDRVTLPAISHLLNWQCAEPALVLVGGFHAKEEHSVWSLAQSCLILMGRRDLYLTCNYLRPGERRTVDIECGDEHRTVVLDDSNACYRVTLGAHYPVVVNFKGDGAVVPHHRGINHDQRSLSFEVWFAKPESSYLAHGEEPAQLAPIYCVFSSKKEEDSLRPYHEELLSRGRSSLLLDVPAALEASHAAGNGKNIRCLLASVGAYAHLFNAGVRGRFMYAEHGASPLKIYTYNKHYQRYDLVLLPGDLWVERLTKLYPQLNNRCKSVGYAKVKFGGVLGAAERAERCAKLGLNPNKKLVLFAPSWGGEDGDRGIFNLRYFDKADNLLAIPHDGDYAFAQQLRDEGYRVYTLAKGEVISDYYNLVDVLVSDISSTAVEFAASGKPVLCIAIDRIPHFDLNFRESETRIRIPHTDRYWDFCPVVPASKINSAVADLLAQDASGEAAQARLDSIKDLLGCVGAESATRAVSEILAFLGESALAAQS